MSDESLVITPEVVTHLQTAMAICAASTPEAAPGRLLSWLEALAGPAWTAIQAGIAAAKASGALTPAAIMAFLEASGVTIPAIVQILLPILLPIILSAIGV
jgi:hypothetical protein